MLAALLLLTGWLASARGEQVVISKIMYYPGERQPEYVEIYNNTANAFDLANWRITGQIEFVFPAFNPTNAMDSFMKPFERIVVVEGSPSAARSTYKIPAHVRVLGPWAGRLPKTGGRLSLKDKNNLTLCTVKYSDRGNWSTAARGAGHALVLRNPDRTVDDWRNWTVSGKLGGSPGSDPNAGSETPVANPEVISAASGTVLVDFGDVWRYFGGRPPGTTRWWDPQFNDAAWPQGVGLFGYSTGKVPAPGLRTPVQRGLVTVCFRRKFIYNGPVPAPGPVVIDQIVDDGAVYYLNGQEVGRNGMPGGPLTANTYANRNVVDPIEENGIITIPANLLVKGTNTFAAEVHNLAPTSADLVFGARLKIMPPANRPASVITVTINEVLPGPEGKGFVEFYNFGSQPVNLKGHHLSSIQTNLTRFKIATDFIVKPKAFASLGFTESGLSLNGPISVFLGAPEGDRAVHAVRGFIPDGQSLGCRPAGGRSWFLFGEPTRNAPNVVQTGLASPVRVNEVHIEKKRLVDWVELFNAGRTPVSLNGLFLTAKPGSAERVNLSGALPPGGARSWKVSFPVEQEEVPIYVVDGAGLVQDAHVFAVSKHGDTWQAFPDGTREWFVGTKDSKDNRNAPVRHTDIVINEVMYRPPSVLKGGEYVELFNRGKTVADLTEWTIIGGIHFSFPAGQKIKPGEFLVVAQDAALLRAQHGNLNVIGNFTSKLSNTGELLRLEDAAGNLVSQVDYRPGGDWPELANGGGSSLELIHPSMDTTLSSAWAPSKESEKAKMKPYSYRALYTEQYTMGAPTDFRELHLYLNNAGQCVVENVQLLRNGQPPNIITNVNRASTNGFSDPGWFWQGNHWATTFKNNQLHIISEGHGDNRVNRCEIDAPGLTKGETYELKFNARWISGGPQLVAHTWDWSIAKVFQLEIPSDLGTPGRPNSQLRAGPAAQVEELTHNPAVPRSTDIVKVTCRVASVLPLPRGSVKLYHRANNADNTVLWANKEMTDDGATGDEVAGDGIYSALLPEYQANGKIVEFYVRAASPVGGESILPRRGPDGPALFIVDDQPVPRDLRTQRFVISPHHMDCLTQTNLSKYQFRYPRLSNRYYNMTFISNERDIYYNCRVHPAGSSFTRDTTLNRAKWKIPLDRTFRGHAKLSWDNNSLNTRLARWMLYNLGHPVTESEMVRHLVNNGPIQLMEDVEPIGNDFLNRVFKDGTDGELYRTTYMFFYRDDPNDRGANLRNSTLGLNLGTDPMNYRIVWSKRTRESENDSTALLDMLRTAGENKYTEQEINRIFDLELMFKNWALRGYAKDSDTFSMGTSHNCFFFRKPNDGRWMSFLWDADFAFGGFDPKSQEGFWGGNVASLMDKPYTRRLFYYYIVELLENYTRNSPRVNAWFRAEEDASAAYPVPADQFRTFFTAREPFALKQMGDNYKKDFKITSNGGNAITTTDNFVTLEGTAPYGIFTVIVEDQPKVKCQWPGEVNWKLPEIGLSSGTNTLVVRGIDQWGKTLREERISVIKPSPLAAKP